MKEKVYRPAQFYGKMTTVSGKEFYLLAPAPIEDKKLDSWQKEWPAETWYAVPELFTDCITVNDVTALAFGLPRYVTTSFSTIELYLADGFVWTGDYVDDEAIADDQEPTDEDLQWFHDNFVDVDDIIVEVAND